MEPPPQVEVLEELGIPVDTPEPWFAQLARVRVNGLCEGNYSIGIMPVSQAYIDQAGGALPSDHVLVRQYTDGFCGQATATCWDSWHVRITNMDGAQISQNGL